MGREEVSTHSGIAVPEDRDADAVDGLQGCIPRPLARAERACDGLTEAILSPPTALTLPMRHHSSPATPPPQTRPGHAALRLLSRAATWCPLPGAAAATAAIAATPPPCACLLVNKSQLARYPPALESLGSRVNRREVIH